MTRHPLLPCHNEMLILPLIDLKDPGSLDIIRHAGAIPNLLSMLAVAVHGVNSYHIPRAARAAVDVRSPSPLPSP